MSCICSPLLRWEEELYIHYTPMSKNHPQQRISVHMYTGNQPFLVIMYSKFCLGPATELHVSTKIIYKSTETETYLLLFASLLLFKKYCTTIIQKISKCMT